MEKESMPQSGGSDTTSDAQAAAHGAGPLLQRDYWAVLEGCALAPPDIMNVVLGGFPRFSPPELVEFDAPHGRTLAVGDELDVRIRGAGEHGVRVVHTDACSVTLATLDGHPEAGRITFGCYPSTDGRPVFHIRSRARSATTARYLGFRAAGEAMQTETWTAFIDRVAAVVGEGVRGVVHAETVEVEEEAADRSGAAPEPTFRARSD